MYEIVISSPVLGWLKQDVDRSNDYYYYKRKKFFINKTFHTSPYHLKIRPFVWFELK
jgi:hypothetical protein